MRLIEIHDAHAWDSFQANSPWSQFTQSWSWGEFRRAFVGDIRRYAWVDDHGSWRAALQCEFRPKAFVGGFWFAPRGPVFAKNISTVERVAMLADILHVLFREIKRAAFLRLEPMIDDLNAILPSTVVRSSAANPMTTILVDLDRTEEEILKAMHPKTRYNIRVAEKHDVHCRRAESKQDVDAFVALMQETAVRDKFHQHNESYLRALATYAMNGHGGIRLAERAGIVLAASLEIQCGDTLTYLHGASSSKDRNTMAPFLMHWDAIRFAKNAGVRLYDLWGANPSSKDARGYKDSWEGISRFKRGWGGEERNLVGTLDVPMNRVAYVAVRLLQKIRR